MRSLQLHTHTKKKRIKNAFKTRYKYFEYQIMLFKLINISTTYQEFFNRTIGKAFDNYTIIYFNNILIYLKNKEEHVKHVQYILK